jgi:hypothetical protein
MATVKNGLMRLRGSRTFIAEMLMAFLLAQLTLAVSLAFLRIARPVAQSIHQLRKSLE